MTTKEKITLYLKFAKHLAPKIFEDKTPKIHFEILDFVLNHDFSAVAVFRGAGKSTLLNKILTTCKVFFETEPYTMIISSDKEKAESFLRDIKEMIISANTAGYAIAKGRIWTNNQIEVIVGNTGDEKRFFITAMGAGQDPRGFTYNYQRPTLIICDDIESKLGQYAIANVKNRQKLREWFYADLLPALHPKDGKMILIGTILHEDSLLNNIITAKDKGKWQTLLIPIINDGKPAWKSRFDEAHIEQIKANLKAQGLENEFYQEYMCHAIAPEKQLFRREYLRYFDGLEYSEQAIKLAVNDSLNERELSINKALYIRFKDEKIALKDCAIYSTMDLASYNGHDRTAIITFAIDGKNRIFVLDCSLGHWSPFEKALKATEIYLRFNPVRFGMEKAGAQNDMFYTMAEFSAKTGVRIPIEALRHHSHAKNVRIANLHPYFVSGRIYLNCFMSGLAQLEAELLGFDPDVESKHDDAIDALAYMQEFIANRDFSVDDDDDDDDYFEDDPSWV